MQPLDNVDLIEKLIEDVGFQGLKLRLSESTLFDVLGISLEERIHSKMLSWLLNPSESHGLGDGLLRPFLYAAAKLYADAKRAGSLHSDQNVHAMTPLQAATYSFPDLRIDPEYPLPSTRRPDMVLWSACEKWLCVIENKILAGEGEQQTTAYYEEMLSSSSVAKFESRLFVYLSPKGSAPESPHFVGMSYSVILNLLSELSKSASDLGRIGIDQYVKCLRGQVVGPEALRDICWKLYRNHYRAIKTILQLGADNRLATSIVEEVMRRLQGEEPAIPGQPDWQRREWSHGAAIWPGHWPVPPSGWPVVSYRITFDDPQEVAEEVKLKIQLEGRQFAELRRQFRGLALQKGVEISSILLSDYTVTSKDANDLTRASEEGTDALLAKIRASFEMLDGLVKQTGRQG